jgi:molecular chaperone DnaJ
VNPGDSAAERTYEQIQEAYRILGDPARRGDYDRGLRLVNTPAEVNVAFEGFDFSAPAEGPLAATFSELFADVFQQAAREVAAPGRGTDIALAVEVPFLDAMRGCRVPLSVTRQERCQPCGGAGRVASAASLCPSCRGEGARRWARGHMVFTKPCEVCGGDGHVAAESCRTCRGVGVLSRTEVVTLGIPAGIDSGTRVAVPGRGHAGSLGGAAGDLYVTVTLGPHPYFGRDGRDVTLTLPTAIHEAALGAVVEVPTIGEPVRMRIPAGTSSGETLRLRGLGVPGNGADEGGDLVVTIQLVLPAELDDRSKALLREFGHLNNEDVRRSVFAAV